MKRRHFLKTTSAFTALSASTPYLLGAKKNKTYRIALVGCGWWGMNILREAMEAGNAKVVALCDVDGDALEVSVEEVNDLSGNQPKSYRDFRELFSNEEVDIVINATPDHWHALIGIAALEAGAHLFLEKPTGHTIQESRAIVNAAEASGRVVQTGLHRRIGPHHVSGLEFLRNGNLGKIGMVRMFVHGKGGAELPTKNSEPSPNLDWDFYCGPAPMRPFCRKIHPGGFRNFLDFANGKLGDWGVHWLDQMLAWSEEKYPHTVYSTGGRPIKGPAILTDIEQTTDAPGSQVAVYEFESFTATWEHRNYAGNATENTAIGCYFYGEKGIFHMGWRDGWTFYPTNPKDEIVHDDPIFDDERNGDNITLLWADFIRAIETGSQPAADVLSGHLSTSLSLLGMLSLKLGRSVRWDGENERIIDDPEANLLLRRDYRGEWEYPAV